MLGFWDRVFEIWIWLAALLVAMTIPSLILWLVLAWIGQAHFG